MHTDIPTIALLALVHFADVPPGQPCADEWRQTTRGTFICGTVERVCAEDADQEVLVCFRGAQDHLPTLRRGETLHGLEAHCQARGDAAHRRCMLSGGRPRLWRGRAKP